MQGAMEKHKSGFCQTYETPQEWLRYKGEGVLSIRRTAVHRSLHQDTEKPSGNLSQPPPEEEEGPALGDGGNDDDDHLSETPLASPSSPPPPASMSSLRTSSVTSTLPQHQDHQSEPIKQHIPKKKKHPAKYDDVDKAFMEYLDRKKASSSKREQLATTEPREEALKMFLLSFLPDLMKMDDGEVRQFKRKTLDAVDDIISARYTSTRPPSSSCPSLSNDSSFSNQIPSPT